MRDFSNSNQWVSLEGNKYIINVDRIMNSYEKTLGYILPLDLSNIDIIKSMRNRLDSRGFELLDLTSPEFREDNLFIVGDLR